MISARRNYAERYETHHAEAEKDIDRANEATEEQGGFFLKRAHVHAMLAVAAATIASGDAAPLGSVKTP